MSAAFNLVPNVVVIILTSEAFAFKFILLEKRVVSEAVTNIKSNAACVFILIGLSASAVLFILSNDKADFNAALLDSPVPPLETGKIPSIFSASTVFAYCA